MAPRAEQYYEAFIVELQMDEHGKVRRTRVMYVQTGAEERWAGWDGTRLLRFILSHSGPSFS